MKKAILFFAAAGLLMTSCQKFKKAEGGLEYKIVDDNAKEKAVSGDLLALDMVVKTDRDSTMQSTYDMGVPQIVQLYPDSIIAKNPGDPTGLFKYVGEGDSLVFKINLDSMAAKTHQPKPEFADKFIVYSIKVKKHFKKGKLTDQQLGEQVQKYFEEELNKHKSAEPAKLEKYIKDKNLKTTKTASGLQYVITKPGTGTNAKVGDSIHVNYVGSLTTGKVFDTNLPDVAKKEKVFNPQRPYEALKFQLGVDGVIPGWTEAFQLFNKGTKATLVIPSSLAYGDRPSGVIPPYAPLVFEVEVLDIKPGKVPAPTATTPGMVAPTGTTAPAATAPATKAPAAKK
ncbi:MULTISPECIES: FKBP-type peptidyl-prolyl cis-trans isomerase [Sphingobacterium]|jgi:FKBP-type peptidyl-prolyl cis-trans isomerase|uniref:FKBP-type peptidyl-prolyl cis-trans isomerase n=1 Tax=Sphingobacterium TaxID=28453 RepID=UPI000DFA736F|nr:MULTISPECIES: FKBP-type peptidyl-prolyl cis-trans isomerase [Sphingobacterium]QQT42789.1 FKBP-type peptidyl-prolyl cis-trans isomerase [Sphingobacterium multivorum]QRQ60427.1 FKBP-type peptidyl-prolyl cis-trans isomerase [Sphingobacterium multivorum]SUJ02251.1 Probable FKBP-type peptidyl-prolyl cis-trans isomerase [Sphingobacterium multivorum]HAL53652.1 peptidylprolyl isomerase [Sphingobacterium sp.]